MANLKNYTPEEVITALEANAGIISSAADALACTAETVRNYIKTYPEVKQAQDEIRNRIMDLAESKLLSLINKGDRTAVFYVLNNLGGERGYGRKRKNNGQFAHDDDSARDQAVPSDSSEIILPNGQKITL